MRTNIDLDEKLINKVIKLTGAKTKKEAVNNALKYYIGKLEKKDLRDLRGKIKFNDDYNYKDLR